MKPRSIVGLAPPALCAVVWVATACGDAPWAAGATLSITPNVLVMSPLTSTSSPGASGSMGAASAATVTANSTLPTQQVMTIYGSGPENKPAEGAHLDVCVGNTCPPSGGYSPGATATQFVQISPVSVAAGASACSQVSPWQLTCILGVDGSAPFNIASTSTVDSNLPLMVTASSGSNTIQAQVFIGRPLADGATLTILPISAGVLTQNGSVVCGAAETQCSALVRASSASVQITAMANSLGTASGPQPVLGTVVDVDVSIAKTPGSSAAGQGWLSKSSDCSSPQTNLPTPTSASTATASFFVCTDGLAGSYDISAIAGSLSAPVTTSAPTTVRVDAVPFITAVFQACTAGSDGGAAGNVSVSVHDCTSHPIASAPVSWSVGTASSMTPLETGASGQGCIGVPVPNGDAGNAYISLDFSTCSGPLIVQVPQ